MDGFRLRLAGHGRDDSCVAASDNAVRIFALHRLGAELSRSAVSKLLPPITVNGIRYRVLRLEGGGGLRFLLRSDDGELFGVYGRNAQAALSAAPLELKLAIDNPFRGFDFFETAEGGLLVRRWRLASVFDRMRVFPNKTFHRSVP